MISYKKEGGGNMRTAGKAASIRRSNDFESGYETQLEG